MYQFFISNRLKHFRVTRSDLSSWGISLARFLGKDEEFHGSTGWVTRFCDRWLISLRSVSNLCKYDNCSLVDKAVKYFAFLQEELMGIPETRIILADQTAVYLEDPQRTTLDVIGARHVQMNTTGFASMRVTAMVACRADGELLAPTVVFKNNGIAK